MSARTLETGKPTTDANEGDRVTDIDVYAACKRDEPASLEDEVSGIRFNPLALRLTSRGPILGSHPKLLHILKTVDRIARSSCTVLVSGESGTGKELIVAAIHDASPRASHPLVTINCGAIPSDLVESELFGHVRGAFTGALTNRRGHISTAEGGTLFLDEVGELPLAAQVKLLRTLQQREYTPLGESRAVRCDVRVIAATNRNLAKDAAAGTFREDLFYRLNVIHIVLPPLRERGDDVLALAEHFFRLSATDRPDLVGLSAAATAAISGRNWPGNIRELENTIERGVLLSAGPYLEPESLFESLSTSPPRAKATPVPLQPPNVKGPEVPGTELPAEGVNLYSCIERYQNSLILQALARTGGNKNRAARLLGLNRTTLVEMIRRRKL